MAKHERFHLKTLEELKTKLAALNLTLPLSDDFSPLFQTLKIGPHTVPNRFAIHPMEGFDSTPEGAPQAMSFRRYKRYAAGGSGLIWFEATAVRHDCRTNSGQFWINKATLPVFTQLVAETRKTAQDIYGATHRPLLILQITHSGRYSKWEGKPRPIIAHHSEVLDPVHKLPKDYPLITDEELDKLKEDFLNAARLAKEAGFDGVDIKSCHRYLISELLASFTRENSRYGGSFENRTRFLLETAKLIHDNVKGLFVTSRLNVFDAIRHPFGWGVSKENERVPDLTEPLKLIQLLRGIDYPILNLSIANPYFNPHWGRPYDFPIENAPLPEMHPLEGVANIIQIIGQVQKANPDLPVIGTGYAWLRHLMPFVAAGVVKENMATLIGQGRGAFAYPDSVRDLKMKGGMDPKKSCVACSACTQIMRDGGTTGCVIRDHKIYGPIYRGLRSRSEDTLKKEAQRCRDCEYSNCQSGCPAGVDVPGFIKAFERGDIKASYDILRQGNVLPELCAYVCPSGVQCEQNCMEAILKGAAVPIREIQKYVSKKAREMGILSAAIPEKESGKRAAVVGAGPAGIACAVKLIESGFHVDLFDKAKQVGGTPQDLIPVYRLAVGEVLTEAGQILKTALEKKRLELVFNFDLLGQSNGEFLKSKNYDAIFLGLGLGASQSLPKVSRPKQGVEDALAFLKRIKSKTDTRVPAHVAVLGGGNTAMDAAITAKLAGARDVFILYRRSFAEMPAWPEEREKAVEKNIHFLTLTQPIDYTSQSGKLTGLKLVRTMLGEPDKSGRRKPEVVPHSEHLFPVELVIEAIGQNPVKELEKVFPSLQINESGFIKVDASFKTNLPGIFAGGDIVNGGTTVVRAVAEGMKAAFEIVKSTK